MVGQMGSYGIRLVATMVLARLLTPEDYGLIAMVAVVINFAGMFKDMGLSMATIQQAEITHQQVSNLFWINLAASTLIGILLAALSPVVAWFYGEPRLVYVTMALAATFPLSGLIIQHQALLRRQMRFKGIALIQIGSMIFSVIIAIFAALQGLEYWALVLLQVAGPIAILILIWLLCPWVPSFPKRHSGSKSMIFFGSNVTGFNIINYFARNGDDLLIGKFWGIEQLGFYNKAYQLLMLPLRQINGPVGAVAIPALSRIQHDIEKFKVTYLKIISYIYIICFPLISFMIIFCEEVILAILGEQWIGSVKIFSILGFSSLIQPLFNSQGWLHLAFGRSDRYLKWGMLGTIAIVLSFLIGLPYGAIGVAVAYTIMTYLIIVPCISYAGKPVNLKFVELIRTNYQAISATVFSVILLLVIKQYYLNDTYIIFRLCLGFSIYSIIYILFLSFFYKGKIPLFELIESFVFNKDKTQQNG